MEGGGSWRSGREEPCLLSSPISPISTGVCLHLPALVLAIPRPQQSSRVFYQKWSRFFMISTGLGGGVPWVGNLGLSRATVTALSCGGSSGVSGSSCWILDLHMGCQRLLLSQ